MIRKIITIDADKCNGCGLCADACHEGAISFEEREALPYDEAAVLANMRAKGGGTAPGPRGCPGSRPVSLSPLESRRARGAGPAADGRAGRLAQCPVLLRVAPVNAPYFAGANILLAAHCAAFAHGNFHEEFMRNKVTLIACPKLDAYDHASKLAEILAGNSVASVTVTRMSVPCCGGLEQIARRALAASGKDIPLRVAIIRTDGAVAG